MGLAVERRRVSALPDFSSRAAARRAAPGPRLSDSVFLMLAGGALVVALLLAFTAGRTRDLARAAEVQARREADAARARLRALAPPSDPSQRLAEWRARTGARASLARVLADVEPALSADTRLERVTVDYGEHVAVALDVVARAARDYDRFVERLAALPAFADVTTGPEQRDGEVRAQVRARYQPSEPETP